MAGIKEYDVWYVISYYKISLRSFPLELLEIKHLSKGHLSEAEASAWIEWWSLLSKPPCCPKIGLTSDDRVALCACMLVHAWISTFKVTQTIHKMNDNTGIHAHAQIAHRWESDVWAARFAEWNIWLCLVSTRERQDSPMQSVQCQSVINSLPTLNTTTGPECFGGWFLE